MQQEDLHYRQLIDRVMDKIEGRAEEPLISYECLASFSNNVYAVQVRESAQAEGRKYLLKVFREYLVEFSNKSIENEVVVELARRGHYPRVHYASREYRLEDFIEGTLPSTDTFSQQTADKFVDRLVGLVQTFGDFCQAKDSNFKKLRTLQHMYSEFGKVNAQCQARFPDAYNICKQYSLAVLTPETVAKLQKIVPAVLVPSHNDCLFHNMIVGDSGVLYLIDYEFFGLNYRGFELGNFFNEYATDYLTFEIKEELELTPQLKRRMIQHYYEGIQAGIPLEQAEREVEVGRLLSHLFWLFIGVKQVRDPKLTIDMQYYIRRRYEQFTKILGRLAQ